MTETIVKGYKYRLLPTQEQEIIFSQTFGCVRKMWNTLLDEGKQGIYRKITEIKEEYPYMKRIDSQSLTSTWKDLSQTFKNVSNKACGYPKFKSKYNSVQSYTTHKDCSNLKITDNKIYLRKVGNVKIVLHRDLPSSSKIKHATISRIANEYYISLTVECIQTVKEKENNVFHMLGLDYSPSLLYVDQEGESPEHIKQFIQELKHEEEKVKKLSKIMSRRVKGSNNWLKAKLKLQKQQFHIKNKRKDFLHKESRKIANRYDTVVIEDLNLKSMGEKPDYSPKENIDYQEATKAKRGRKNMFRVGYHTFTTMLEYKLREENKELIKVYRYFASTKTCPICNHTQDMPTEIRTYQCTECGHTMDRDQNAALNLVLEGYRLQTKHEIEKWIS